MVKKLGRKFYLRRAEAVAEDLLGKYLIINSPQGRLSGKIVEVEAYPAFADHVSHGNKRTKRTEIMYGPGGYAYVYLIYGLHHQFAAVVNHKEIPEVVFVRAVIPVDGIELMKFNFKRSVTNITDLTKSPGNLCRSFGITLKHYGMDLTGSRIYLEDRGVEVSRAAIKRSRRVGIASQLAGSKKRLRFYIKS